MKIRDKQRSDTWSRDLISLSSSSFPRGVYLPPKPREWLQASSKPFSYLDEHSLEHMNGFCPLLKCLTLTHSLQAKYAPRLARNMTHHKTINLLLKLQNTIFACVCVFVLNCAALVCELSRQLYMVTLKGSTRLFETVNKKTVSGMEIPDRGETLRKWIDKHRGGCLSGMWGRRMSDWRVKLWRLWARSSWEFLFTVPKAEFLRRDLAF